MMTPIFAVAHNAAKKLTSTIAHKPSWQMPFGLALLLPMAILTMLFLLTSPLALAQATANSPQAIMKQLTEEGLTRLRDPNQNEEALQQWAEKTVLPHFNMRLMTMQVVRRPWRDASESERKQLVDEFSQLIVRSYLRAALNYRDVTPFLEYTTIPGGNGDQVVRVRFRIVNGAKETSSIVDFRFGNTKDGMQIYDVGFDGISLLTSFAEAYAESLKTGGVGGLIKIWQEKYKEPLSKKSN